MSMCLGIFLSCQTITAGPVRYTCEVLYVYNLADDGSLEVSNWQETMAGSNFSVSRETGKISGAVLPTVRAKSTQVINPGSKEYSFKAVADFGNQHQLLEVQEFKDVDLKPFVATSMGGAGIVTGLCE